MRSTTATPATTWTSQTYSSPDFGNYLHGLGVRLDMGATVTVNKIRVTVPAGGVGAHLEFKVGDDQSRGLMQAIDKRTTTAGTFDVTPGKAPRGRYILLWFTSLPSSNKAQIGEVTVSGSR